MRMICYPDASMPRGYDLMLAIRTTDSPEYLQSLESHLVTRGFKDICPEDEGHRSGGAEFDVNRIPHPAFLSETEGEMTVNRLGIKHLAAMGFDMPCTHLLRTSEPSPADMALGNLIHAVATEKITLKHNCFRGVQTLHHRMEMNCREDEPLFGFDLQLLNISCMSDMHGSPQDPYFITKKQGYELTEGGIRQLAKAGFDFSRIKPYSGQPLTIKLTEDILASQRSDKKFLNHVWKLMITPQPDEGRER